MWTLKGYQNLRCRKINVKISLLRSKGGITSDDQEYKSIFQSQEICMREVSHDRSYQEPRNLYFKAVSHVNIGQVSREQSLSKQYFINQELTSLPSKLPLQILTLKGSETTGTWRDWQGGKKKAEDREEIANTILLHFKFQVWSRPQAGEGEDLILNWLQSCFLNFFLFYF